MGILNSSNLLFLNVSCGFMVNKAKEIKTRGYVGFFKSIERTVDTFEDKDIEKFKLHMIDEHTGEEAVIGFTAESWFTIGFFSRIMSINLSRPFTLGVSQSEQNEKISFCWMKQDGLKVPKDEQFPLPKDVKLGSKVLKDWSETDIYIKDCVDKLNDIIQHTEQQLPAPAADPIKDNPIEKSDFEGEGADDLPF